MNYRLILSILIISLCSLPLFAEDWITIYNDDLSLIRSQFELELEKGIRNTTTTTSLPALCRLR